MAITLFQENMVTFSEVFSSWLDHPTPFYKEDGLGGVKQAWFHLNLISQHVSIRFTEPTDAVAPVIMEKSGIALIPAPALLTGKQMDGLMVCSGTLDDLLDGTRFDLMLQLKGAVSQGIEVASDGSAKVPDAYELFRKLERIHGHLADLASTNELVDARQLSLAELGLRALGDDGQYHKDYSEVTQLWIKASGEPLLTEQQVIGLSHRLEAYFQNSGRPAALIGVKQLLNDFADLTQETTIRLQTGGRAPARNAQEVVDLHNPVEMHPFLGTSEVENELFDVSAVEITYSLFHEPFASSEDSSTSSEEPHSEAINHKAAGPRQILLTGAEGAAEKNHSITSSLSRSVRSNPLLRRPHDQWRGATAYDFLSDRYLPDPRKIGVKAAYPEPGVNYDARQSYRQWNTSSVCVLPFGLSDHTRARLLAREASIRATVILKKIYEWELRHYLTNKAVMLTSFSCSNKVHWDLYGSSLNRSH